MCAKETALRFARALLSESLPSRYRHVAGVAQKVEEVCCALGLNDEDAAVAAWLHDIGYAPVAVETGFHALDGARWAARQGFSNRVTALIAHHSCARLEAEIRGMGELLDEEFPQPDRELSQILTAADMSVGPGGQLMTMDARLSDIRSRYATEDVVTRFVDAAEASLRAAKWEVTEWLAQSQ